jgi:hypothetical protein
MKDVVVAVQVLAHHAIFVTQVAVFVTQVAPAAHVAPPEFGGASSVELDAEVPAGQRLLLQPADPVHKCCYNSPRSRACWDVTSVTARSARSDVGRHVLDVGRVDRR